MDSAATKVGFLRSLLRLFSCLSSFLGVVSLSYVLGFLLLSFSIISIAPPVSLPSNCKIVSSSVDLRSSEICELGLLNFKAKHVFYPSERRKFRCHYDYYWTSVFKVEYFDHLSGQRLLGFAEAPKEALPPDCRPDFGAALLTKHKFKVNESYSCWYSSGISKIQMFEDHDFGCDVKDPSGTEMIRRYFVLSTRMLERWLDSPQLTDGLEWWGMTVGVMAGFFTPLILILLLRVLQPITLWLPRVSSYLMATLLRRLFLTRAFFLLVYLSFVGWLAIEYGKRIGLPLVSVEY